MAVAFEKNACTADTNYESCTNPTSIKITVEPKI